MTAVVLAGGLGSRLRSVISDRTKPMGQLAARPFLNYVLLWLKKSGIKEIVFCIGHKGEVIRRWFGEGRAWGVMVRYSQEPELRGTAGALKLAERFLHAGEFVVANGDTFFDVDLRALLDYQKSLQAIASMALHRVRDPERYGAVEIDEFGKIVRFREKTNRHEAEFINGGIYVFNREVLSLIPEDRAVSLEQEIFPALIGKAFYGRPFEGFFVDIGVPADYLRLRADPGPLLAAIGN